MSMRDSIFVKHLGHYWRHNIIVIRNTLLSFHHSGHYPFSIPSCMIAIKQRAVRVEILIDSAQFPAFSHGRAVPMNYRATMQYCEHLREGRRDHE